MKPAARVLIFMIAGLSGRLAQSQDAGWLRVVKDGETEVLVYQPQPYSLDGVTLQARTAVSVKRQKDKPPVFGALWVIATLDFDPGRDLARFQSVKIDRARFADMPEGEVRWLVHLLETHAPLWDNSTSLTGLKTDLQQMSQDLLNEYHNDPPKIVVVDCPAILLLLDGEPRLQDVGPGGLQ
jgi:hypothetical protein